MRQRGVLGALSAAAFLGVAVAAVVLPATVAAASVSPAPASTVGVNLAGEARVGALLTATLDFERWVAPSDVTSFEFEWLIEKPAVLPVPAHTPTSPAASTEAPLARFPTPVATPDVVPQLSCAQPPAVAPDAAALLPSGLSTPAPSAFPTPAPQPALLAALPALSLLTEAQLPAAQDHAQVEPTPAPALPTANPRGPEYTVLPADLGHTIRVRATVSVGGQLVATCESAPTALVVAADAPRPGEAEEPLTPLRPSIPAEAVAPPAETAPSQWRPSHSAHSGETGGNSDEVLAQPAPAASGPVVAISLSSEVMLIGGAAVLVVVAGLAIFGRNES